MTLAATLHTEVEQAFKALLRINGTTYADWLRDRVFAEFASANLEDLKRYFPNIESTLGYERERLNKLAQTDAVEEEFLAKVREVFKRVEA